MDDFDDDYSSNNIDREAAKFDELLRFIGENSTDADFVLLDQKLDAVFTHFFEKNLTIYNCFEAWQKCDGKSKLAEKCKQYIEQNFVNFCKSFNFLNLSSTH